MDYDARGTLIDSNGRATVIGVDSVAAFTEDLEVERADIEEDLEKYNIQPTLTLGFIYQF